jgi:hypothetical protein
LLHRLALALLLLSGCPEGDPLDDDDDTGASLAPAAGATVDFATLSQGVQRELDGVDDLPVIAGRDALLRLHVSTDGDYDGGPVTARLTVGEEVLEVEGELAAESAQDDLGSTVNFILPGDLVSDPLTWSASLLQPDGAGAQDVAAEGEVEVEGAANVFRMVIAPFSYEFDGSGRLPDTSPEQVERIRQTFLKVYPVSDVEITVREPQAINTELSPNGDGWILAGIPLIGFRQTDGAADDVYYYGMFNPAENLQAFCGFGGCLLGVTLLNNDPPDTGSVSLRVALGVGFTEQAPWVAVHEIGHAHGRPHTPCSPPNNPPADIDPNYPIADGSLDRWGWDLVEDALVSPDATDFMGYCDDQWTSAYTWRAMHARSQNVNRGFAMPGPRRTWDVIAVDRRGARWGEPITRAGTWAGDAVEVVVDGERTAGRFVRWDHMPGGLLAFPRTDGAPRAAEFVIDGLRYRAER